MPRRSAEERTWADGCASSSGTPRWRKTRTKNSWRRGQGNVRVSIMEPSASLPPTSAPAIVIPRSVSECRLGQDELESIRNGSEARRLADSDTFLRAAALILCLAAGLAIADEPPLSPVALGRIDAHVHFFAEAKPVLEGLYRLNVTGVNICVVDRYDPGYETAPPQHEMAPRLARASGARLPGVPPRAAAP